MCLIVLALAALPSAARAQGGILDFFEQWSGPGPFNYGPSFTVRLGCQLKKGTDPADRKFVFWLQHDLDDKGQPREARSCAARGERVQAFLDLRYMRGSMDDHHPLFSDRQNELFTDHARGVNLASNVMEALLMRQILDPAFAVGFGGGLVWFDGGMLDNGSPHRVVITPLAVDVSPFRLFWPKARWARGVVLQFQESAFFGNVAAKDFNTASTSNYSSRTELFRTFNINFDIVSMIAND